MKIRKCPECHGYGGYTEPVLDYGEGPFIPCGFCDGVCELPPSAIGLWLNMKKKEKHEKIKLEKFFNNLRNGTGNLS